MQRHHTTGFTRCRTGAAALLLLALACSSAPAWAQGVPVAASGAPLGATLYEALGAQPGLVRLMDDFAPRLLADPRLQPFFKDVKMAELKDKLVVQICELAGGPCRRKGPDMAKAHAGFDIARKDFNALVEVLQDSLDAQQIPFRTQTRLLALLAPMHREIVNVP